MTEDQKTELKQAMEGKAIVSVYRGRYVISIHLSDSTIVEFSTTTQGPNGEEAEITARVLKI